MSKVIESPVKVVIWYDPHAYRTKVQLDSTVINIREEWEEHTVVKSLITAMGNPHPANRQRFDDLQQIAEHFETYRTLRYDRNVSAFLDAKYSIKRIEANWSRTSVELGIDALQP